MAVGDVTTEVVGTTFKYVIEAPRSLRAHPEYEKMVWDACLKAHEAGHVPVGAILITDEDIASGNAESGGAKPVEPSSGGLPEGASMSDRISDWFRRNGPAAVADGFNTARSGVGMPPINVPIVTPPTMRVTAEVEIASSLVDYANDKLEEITQEKAAEHEYGEQVHDLDAELARLLDEEGA
jgi:hypothetical protein